MEASKAPETRGGEGNSKNVAGKKETRKGYQRQKEQKQAKTDKKRKRQVQERNLRKVIKAGSARYKKRKSMKAKLKLKDH
ncbi:hypothetical protein Tco_0364945 [Tanacetum coccineum]